MNRNDFSSKFIVGDRVNISATYKRYTQGKIVAINNDGIEILNYFGYHVYWCYDEILNIELVSPNLDKYRST